MQIPVYKINGEVAEQIEISEEIFGIPFNEAVVHQALLRQRANARQGNACTKTRGEVDGSTKKLFAQKHTGEARAGNSRLPLRYKGGVTFGPRPRDYHQDMPKKMRQLALKSVLSAKLNDGELKVLEDFDFDAPKTKAMAQMLAAIGVDVTTLFVTADPKVNIIKSARNITGVKTLPAGLLNVVDLLSHKMLVMTVPAVRKAEKIWGPKAQEEDNATA